MSQKGVHKVKMSRNTATEAHINMNQLVLISLMELKAPNYPGLGLEM